jgi:hypothetical protein
MGAKWERSKQWDDRHLPPALWPVKAILRLFSSVYFGVGLLVLVSIYGVLASIPIGMLALIPTNMLYALSFVAVVGLVAGVPLTLAWRFGLRRVPGAARFVILFFAGLGLSALGAWAWNHWLWPVLHYVPATGEGFRLFAAFCQLYQSTTLRRLPGMEMTELEFYSWWPLRLILLLFVANMIVSTVRRIEFTVPNLGVLTVHTGIVTIACGSIFYAGLKKEGDTILLAGPAAADGTPTVGPPQTRFYDNTQVALYINQRDAWEQRPLRNIPRYNDYNLAAGQDQTASAAAGFKPMWDTEDDPKLQPIAREHLERTLDIPVSESLAGLVDPDLRFRIVGYAQYAEPAQDWLRVDPTALRTIRPGFRLNPLRIVDLFDLRTPAMKRAAQGDAAPPAGEEAKPIPLAEARPVFAFTLLPEMPAHRISDNRLMAVEYTIGMPESRWRDLSEPLPPDTHHALVVEVPASGFRQVYPVTAGQTLEIGQTGYRIEVSRLEKDPPFPIITEGYKGSSSSVAIMRITTPEKTGFERWVYHRFPEISQDMLDEVNERGMPKRRDADPSIRVTLIDADQIQIYFDEHTPSPASPAVTRAIVRDPGGKVRTFDSITGAGVELIPYVQLVVQDRWAHAEAYTRPRPVPAASRDRQFIGTHDKAMLAVEVSSTSFDFRRIVWTPFVKYLGVQQEPHPSVELPDGRRIELAFGRRQHRLPGFAVQLADFQMLAYDHRGSPRDYQSVVRVNPTGDELGFSGSLEFEPYEHVTKLNAPLRAPFHWDDSRLWISNFLGRLSSGLNPNQYKFSQAGWDASGWEQTQAMTDQGLLKRPRASFTILGVGNNPGIHVIALGAVLMGVGIPWAFYVKPWLLRRAKRRIQEQLKAGTYVRPPAASRPDREESPEHDRPLSPTA